MKTGFWKLSSSGNTTLFLESRCDAKRALAAIPSEQAGFVNFPERRLEMAGGEFCVNACLAFGALLDALGFLPDKMRIGDIEVKLHTQGAMPLWQTQAEFPLPANAWEEKGQVRICHLDGISHALLPCEELPAAKECLAAAESLRSELNLEGRAACGIVWWQGQGNRLELRPVVSVPALNTCNLEQACGSASVALALWHGPGEYEIRQPSGKSLSVEILPDLVRVAAEVSLQAEGHLWSGDVGM